MRRITAGAVLLLLLYLALIAFSETGPAKAAEPIHIRADGSLEGTDAIRIEGNTYTLIANIDNPFGVIVEKDNIIIDGASYTIQGSGNNTGIEIMYRNNITIKNAYIINFEYGIILDGSTGCTVSENTLKSNIGGILIYRSTNNIINKNSITQNAVAGIQFERASSNIISANNITENGSGILINGVENSTFYGNNIADSKFYGVMFTQVFSSTNSTFYDNNFVNNPQQVETQGQRNSWDNGSYGNYWSDDVGIDQNKDGVSEYPYTIDENNTDRKPLVDPFLIPEFPVWVIPTLVVATALIAVIIKKKSPRATL